MPEPARHRPRPLDLPSRYAIEGLVPTRAGPVRRRLGVDSESGLFIAPGGLPLEVEAAGASLLLPGFIDLHVHCRDDPSGRERHKEDYESATFAAIHGGVSALGDMPNNPEPPVDEESYRRKRELADEKAGIEVVVYGGVTRRGPFRRGLPWKCYFGPSVGELHDRQGFGDALGAFRGEWIAFHAEDPDILEASRGAPTHEDRRPPEAERAAIERILLLARTHGFRPHIAHLSTAAGLAEIRRARADGLAVTCEVAPHHLFFDRENRASFACGDWLQMNPPLRTPADRRALLDGLRDGEIDALATDHAPHTIDENRRGVSGVPLLDTFAPFLAWLAAHEGFTWPRLIECASRRPAEIFAPFLHGRHGVLEEGCAASFVVLDPGSPWKVLSEDIRSRAGWSPFEGVILPATVRITGVRGRAWSMEA